ncbi:MAG: ROK family protein [Anaerolineae bacterium]
MDWFDLGVDLGGTQIRAALRRADGRMVSRVSTATRPEEGPERVIARILDTIRQAAGDTPWSRIRGIGIGAPGPLDPFEGVILRAPNLPGWDCVPLQAIIADTFGVRARLGNDANVAALGEYTFGAGRGAHNLVYVTISTGIGGGIIVDDRLLLGAGGFAGEVGHQVIVEDGLLCNCGNRGCVETLATGPAIARMGRAAAAAGQSPCMLALAGGGAATIDAPIVAEAARLGDPAARAILVRAASAVGIGLANLCNLLNPELIILGGGVTHVGDLLFNTVRATIAERAMPVMRRVQVVPAALGDDVVLLGAIALLHEKTRAAAPDTTPDVKGQE